MRVLCIHGYEGVLEEGETYTVREVTDKGNYLLTEVDPPQPYGSFKHQRFISLPEATDEELMAMEEYFGGDQDWA